MFAEDTYTQYPSEWDSIESRASGSFIGGHSDVNTTSHLISDGMERQSDDRGLMLCRSIFDAISIILSNILGLLSEPMILFT